MSSNTRQAAIQFQHFIVKESHIVFNEPGDYRIKIKFKPQGAILPSFNHYQLQLEVIVEDEEDKFRISLQTMSVFSYNPEIDMEELRSSYFIHNAPAIIFPYLRAYISALTALSGMPTLTLPTMNLSSLGEELKKNTSVVEEI